MRTRYCLSYRPKNGQPENFTSFDSATARALFVISLSPFAEIVRTWEEAEAA